MSFATANLLAHVPWVPVLGSGLGLAVLLLWVLVVVSLRSRRIRNRLEEESNRLHLLLDSTDHVILMYDRKHRITYYNGSEELIESASEVMGKTPRDLFDSATAERIIAQNDLVFSTAAKQSFEGSVSWRGNEYWFRTDAYPVFDSAGNVTQVVKFASNSTELKQMEQQIEQDRQRFRIVGECTADLVFDWDLQSGEVTWLGDVAGLLPGLEGRVDFSRVDNWARLVVPEDRQDYLEMIEQVRAGRLEKASREFRIGRDGSDCRYWVARGALVRDEQGRPWRWIGAVSDMTSQRRQAVALQESERRFESLMQKLDEIVWTADSQNRLTYVSAAVERISGYSRQQFFNQPGLWSEIVHPDDRETFQRSQQQLDEDGQADLEYRIITRDGEPRWIRDRKAVVRDEQGQFLRYGGICADITARKEAEQLLRVSEQTYKALFDGPNAVKLLIDPSNGQIVDANIAAGRYYGYSVEDLKTMHISDINIWSADEVHQAMRRARKLQDNHFIFRHRLADGRIRDVEVYSNPVEIQGRELLFSIIHDVTDRRQAERALLEHERQLQQMASELALVEERHRQAMAAALHDRIGQSLAALKVRAGLLKQASDNEEVAHRAERMVNDLDGLIREAWNLTFALCPPVLYEMGLEAALESLAEEYSQSDQLQVEFFDDGRDKDVPNDIRGMLYQMVRELLQNVVKHAEASRVRLACRREQDALWIMVEDDGKGLNNKDLRTAGKAGPGGFGLFSIRERLGHMGGRLEITPGSDLKGACVTIILPLANANIEDKRDADNQDTAGRRPSTDEGRAQGAAREAG
ncbi:MAG: PAS domain S-box protein [Phycisphaerae bacterium]